MHTNADEVLALYTGEGRFPQTKFYLLGIIDDIAVLRTIDKPLFDEVPFTAALRKNGKWEKTGMFVADADTALLMALGIKHEGLNTRFHNYATRMLDIRP